VPGRLTQSVSGLSGRRSQLLSESVAPLSAECSASVECGEWAMTCGMIRAPINPRPLSNSNSRTKHLSGGAGAPLLPAALAQVD
jgi:hypothetical protein